jgi:hypothetical protein
MISRTRVLFKMEQGVYKSKGSFFDDDEAAPCSAKVTNRVDTKLFGDSDKSGFKGICY